MSRGYCITSKLLANLVPSFMGLKCLLPYNISMHREHKEKSSQIILLIIILTEISVSLLPDASYTSINILIIHICLHPYTITKDKMYQKNRLLNTQSNQIVQKKKLRLHKQEKGTEQIFKKQVLQHHSCPSNHNWMNKVIK